MIIPRQATSTEARHDKAIWAIVYSVAFKKPRVDTLRWVTVPSAIDEITASKIASPLREAGYQEYGITRQLMICHHPDTKDQWFQQPDNLPTDLDKPLKDLVSVFSA